MLADWDWPAGPRSYSSGTHSIRRNVMQNYISHLEFKNPRWRHNKLDFRFSCSFFLHSTCCVRCHGWACHRSFACFFDKLTRLGEGTFWVWCRPRANIRKYVIYLFTLDLGKRMEGGRGVTARKNEYLNIYIHIYVWMNTSCCEI